MTGKSGKSTKGTRGKAAASPVVEVAAEAPVEAPVEVVAEAIAAETTAPVEETPVTESRPAPKTLKETVMSTLPGFDFSVFQTAFTDFQDKTKAAYEKGTGAFGDANAFAKGNVEAFVESGKILAAGLQALGNSFVADSRETFEALTAEAKELAAAKSPTDFFKLQSELAKKHFDTAVAYGSKSSEAVLKLASEAAAPLSNRVSLAVETIQKAA